jgi:hypothetical protein
MTATYIPSASSQLGPRFLEAQQTILSDPILSESGISTAIQFECIYLETILSVSNEVMAYSARQRRYGVVLKIIWDDGMEVDVEVVREKVKEMINIIEAKDKIDEEEKASEAYTNFGMYLTAEYVRMLM